MPQTHQKLIVAEEVIKGLVKGLSDDIRLFFTGLHNAFAHGKICPNVCDQDLREMFIHFEELIAISKRTE